MGCCEIRRNPYYATSECEFHTIRALMVTGVAVSSFVAVAGIFGILGASGVLPQSVSFLGFAGQKGMQYAIGVTVAGVALTAVTGVVAHKYWPVYNPLPDLFN